VVRERKVAVEVVIFGVDGRESTGCVTDPALRIPVPLRVGTFRDRVVALRTGSELFVDLLQIDALVNVGELVEPLEV